MQIPLLIAFARSAGTYANKVLGSHADLAVLSEVNPAFSTRSPVWQAVNWLGLFEPAEADMLLSASDFAGQVRAIADRAATWGKTLIVRDWVTVNFLSGAWHGISSPSMVLENVFYLRQAGLAVNEAVLVRDGLSVYHSMQRNCVQFSDLSLDVFAASYLHYAQAVADYPHYQAEEFKVDPAGVWGRIFAQWGLPFDESSLDRYADFDRCTGDNTLDRPTATHHTRETPAPPATALLAKADKILGYDR